MKLLLKSRGFWYGLFGINLFMFVITVQAFSSGIVGVDLPILNLLSAGLCLYAANRKWEDGDDEPN